MTGPIHRMRRFGRVLAALGGALLTAQSVAAQQAPAIKMGDHELLAAETYVRPPAVIERIIRAPRTNISFTMPNRDRTLFLRTTGMDRGDVAQFGKPHIYLAGEVIEQRANRARTELTNSRSTGLELIDPRTGAVVRTIQTPQGASVSSPVWSPLGTQVAYVANFADASHVFVADAATGRSTQITRTPLMATLVTEPVWTADGRSVVAVVLPDARGAEPTHGANGIEDGPQVRLSEGRVVAQRIHFSLLQDPHDKALLEYYTTGQLVLIDVRSRAARKIGAPGMFRSVAPSADGTHFLVTQMVEPFSYLVPASSFPTTTQLWDATGKVVAQVGTTPLREEGGGGGGGRGTENEPGKRSVQWHPAGPGLIYLESVMGPAPTGGRAGAGARPQATAVKAMSWVAPYGEGDTKVLYEGSPTLTGITFNADGSTMFVSDSSTVVAIKGGRRLSLGKGMRIQAAGGGGGGGGGGAEELPETAGAIVTRMGLNGLPVVAMASDAKTILVTGTRAPRANWSAQAPRPWADKVDIETGARSRIMDSPANAYDSFVTALDDDFTAYIYTHESPTVIRDAWLKDTRTNANTQLTRAVDVAPEVSGAQRRRIQLTRPRDGVKFWVEVALPADWRPGTRLPGVIWFYPREYTSQQDYDESRYGTNINQFPDSPAARPASMVDLWVTQGYALIEPDTPIMGEEGAMNDNYTRDLEENLDLIVDAMVDAGYVDRNRMGIGGHSYGAFSTVNALSLVPFFKAGIAGDGMYNRSLTPFGFQSERRSFFDVQDTYLDMSPFYRADKISGALLLYHSLEDQNSGTHPISAIRMFHALQGLGKPASMYMYPYEDHSVGTYQTDLDQWARWTKWFELYVKNAGPANVTEAQR